MMKCTCVLCLQGAALGAMVGLLTFGNRKYESLDPFMRTAIPPLHNAVQQLLPLVDKDTQAFNYYLVRGVFPVLEMFYRN